METRLIIVLIRLIIALIFAILGIYCIFQFSTLLGYAFCCFYFASLSLNFQIHKNFKL